MTSQEIRCRFFSQEDLLEAGCLDLEMATDTAREAMLAFRRGRVIFPDKIVQIFDDDSQSRINCLPATFIDDEICGVKWVSVFPLNPARHGVQNLSAVIVLSEIRRGFPIAFMEGTLCSNMRVGAVGALAARYLARPDSETIGFIGAGEQAKMHLLAMKSALPSLRRCRVAGLDAAEEQRFVDQLAPLVPGVDIVGTGADLEAAAQDADVIVTATSTQAPLLEAAWMKPGAFYSHVGGWEDEYTVAESCDKIFCDDWETVKHRTQTLSRMYSDGRLTDDDITGDLIDVIVGDVPGREHPGERIYFNAVGLAYTDVAIAHAMYRRALEAGKGEDLEIQREMIFDHADLPEWVRI